MGLGLQGAYGLAGAQSALRQRIFDSLAQQKQQQDLVLAEREQQLREHAQQGLDEDRRLLRQQQMKAEADRVQGVADKQTETQFTMTPQMDRLAPGLAIRSRALGLPVIDNPGTPVRTLGGFQGGLPGDPGPEGAGMAPVVGSLRVRSPGAVPAGVTTSSADATSPLAIQPFAQRGATEADINKTQAEARQARQDTETERQHREVAAQTAATQANTAAYRDASLAQRDRAITATAPAKAGKGVTLSATGKANLGAIEQAGPLTDQALKMMETEFPDIANHPEKYNTTLDKLGSLYQQGKYKLGFSDENDPRRQIVSLLQPIQAGQYTRSSRSRLMVELALKHMADMSQTPAAQYQRMKELKGIMPEMREGLIRGEQPVDPDQPLKGSYFDPGKQPAAAADPAGIR